MLTNKEKYIPTTKEIETAESMMTDKQKRQTDNRWGCAMAKIKGKKGQFQNEIDEHFRPRHPGLGHYDLIGHQFSKESLNQLISGDPTHSYHYNSLIPNMTQREFIEFKIKDLSDDVLVKFIHSSHSDGATADGVISVGELKKQLQEQEGADSPYIEMQEKSNPNEHGLRAVNLDYHDYDSFEVLGTAIDNSPESIQKKIEEVGALNYFKYFSTEINSSTVSIGHYLLENDCHIDETSIKKLSDKIAIIYQKGTYWVTGFGSQEVERAELINPDKLIKKLQMANSNLHMDIFCNNGVLGDFGIETDNDKLIAEMQKE